MTLTQPMLTLADVAELLNVSERTVLRYARAGTLPGRKIGAQWRFTRAELDEFLETMEERTHG